MTIVFDLAQLRLSGFVENFDSNIKIRAVGLVQYALNINDLLIYYTYS